MQREREREREEREKETSSLEWITPYVSIKCGDKIKVHTCTAKCVFWCVCRKGTVKYTSPQPNVWTITIRSRKVNC